MLRKEDELSCRRFRVPLKWIEDGFGHIIIRSPYIQYSIYLRGTVGFRVALKKLPSRRALLSDAYASLLVPQWMGGLRSRVQEFWSFLQVCSASFPSEYQGVFVLESQKWENALPEAAWHHSFKSCFSTAWALLTRILILWAYIHPRSLGRRKPGTNQRVVNP